MSNTLRRRRYTRGSSTTTYPSYEYENLSHNNLRWAGNYPGQADYSSQSGYTQTAVEMQPFRAPQNENKFNVFEEPTGGDVRDMDIIRHEQNLTGQTARTITKAEEWFMPMGGEFHPSTKLDEDLMRSGQPYTETASTGGTFQVDSHGNYIGPAKKTSIPLGLGPDLTKFKLNNPQLRPQGTSQGEANTSTGPQQINSYPYLQSLRYVPELGKHKPNKKLKSYDLRFVNSVPIGASSTPTYAINNIASGSQSYQRTGREIFMEKLEITISLLKTGSPTSDSYVRTILAWDKQPPLAATPTAIDLLEIRNMTSGTLVQTYYTAGHYNFANADRFDILSDTKIYYNQMTLPGQNYITIINNVEQSFLIPLDQRTTMFRTDDNANSWPISSGAIWILQVDANNNTVVTATNHIRVFFRD